MSHSNRNTSRAFFSQHERDELKGRWGSSSTRLTRDSFLPFGSCQLCLLQARDPVACPSHGHLFCRECALSNLLAQNKELKRLKKEAEKRKLEEAGEKEIEEEEAKARAVEEFERVQAGLSARTGGKANERIVGRNNGKITVEQDVEDGPKGTKRELELDENELVRLGKEGAFKKHSADKASELPSFWVPGETPNHKKSDQKALRQHPACPAAEADQPHEISLKILVTVKFKEEQGTSEDSPSRTCPSCNKNLTNSTKAVLAKPCGHVVCKPCSDKFQKAPEKSAHDQEYDDAVRCYVCHEDITPGRKVKRRQDAEHSDKEKESKIERGMVVLSSDGTGFAGGGKSMVRKQGVAFQC